MRSRRTRESRCHNLCKRVSRNVTGDTTNGDSDSSTDYDSRGGDDLARSSHALRVEEDGGECDPRSQNEKTFVPSALDDVVGRLDDIEPPDEARSTNCPHFSGTASDSIKLLPQPCPIFADGAQERWIRQSVEDVRSNSSHEWTAAECRPVIAWFDCHAISSDTRTAPMASHPQRLARVLMSGKTPVFCTRKMHGASEHMILRIESVSSR